MDPKLQVFIKSLPKFADELYCSAENQARTLLRGDPSNLVTRITGAVAGTLTGGRAKERLLASCIFDLHLTSFFAEFRDLIGVSESALMLVDGLLYQATGSKAGSPTESELLNSGTQNVRGIQKFEAARKTMPLIGDVDAWIFGKEFSAIVSGEPGDIAKIVSVASFSLAARLRARWHIRYLLYGVLPKDKDKQELDATVLDHEKSMQDMIDRLK